MFTERSLSLILVEILLCVDVESKFGFMNYHTWFMNNDHGSSFNVRDMSNGMVCTE